MPSVFDPRAGPGGRWRDIKTGRFVSTPVEPEPIFYYPEEEKEIEAFEMEMWRISAGINGVMQRNYFSCMVWTYTLQEPDEDDIKYIKDRCRKLLYKEKLMKKRWEDEAWYSLEPNISIMRIPFDADLVNEVEEDIEWSR